MSQYDWLLVDQSLFMLKDLKFIKYVWMNIKAIENLSLIKDNKPKLTLVTGRILFFLICGWILMYCLYIYIKRLH